MSDEEAIRDLARYHVRLYSDIGDGRTDVISLTRLLGVCCRLERMPWLSAWRASGFWTPNGFRLIVVNEAMEDCWRRWWTAHELGHIVMEHPAGYDDAREHGANLYALELLLPEGRVRLQMEHYGASPATLATLAGVPMQWAEARLVELDLMPTRVRAALGY